MRKVSRLLFIIIAALLLVISTGYAKSNPQSPATTNTVNAPVQAAILNAGIIEGSTYKNDYFGLTMQIPDNWQIQNKEVVERINQRGREMLAGDDVKMKAALEAAKSNVVNLLTMSKYPLGTPEKVNLIFFSTAEKVSAFSGIQSKDYLLHTKKMLQNGQVKYVFAQDIYSQNVGGTDFSVLEGKIIVQNTTVYQKYYSAIIRDYAYSFVLTYTTPEDLKALKKIVSTMKFAK